MYYEESLLGRLILNGSARLKMPLQTNQQLYNTMLRLRTFDAVDLMDAMGHYQWEHTILYLINQACHPTSVTRLIQKAFDGETKRNMITTIENSGDQSIDDTIMSLYEL